MKTINIKLNEEQCKELGVKFGQEIEVPLEEAMDYKKAINSYDITALGAEDIAQSTGMNAENLYNWALKYRVDPTSWHLGNAEYKKKFFNAVVNDKPLNESTLEEGKDEAKVKKIIKDLQGDFGGDNESQGRGLALLKGLAFSDEKLANDYMKALNTSMTTISKKVLGEKKKESVIKEEMDKQDKLYWINQMDDSSWDTREDGKSGMLYIMFNDNSDITYRLIKDGDRWITAENTKRDPDSKAELFDIYLDESDWGWLIDNARKY